MNKIQPIAFVLLIISSIFIDASQFAIAKDEEDPDYIMDTSKIGQSDDGYIRSDQMLELGSPTSNALAIEGEQNLRQGSLDRALTVLQRSVEMSPLDMDARILYAQTLEKKMMMQKKKKKDDPRLFNFVVKQWFYVYKKSEFLDQKMQGLSHLVELTGTQPKRFENEKKYLARVLIPEDNTPKVAQSGKSALKDKSELEDKPELKNKSELKDKQEFKDKSEKREAINKSALDTDNN